MATNSRDDNPFDDNPFDVNYDSEENDEETIDTETESEKEVDDDSNTASPMEVPCKSKNLSTEISSCPPHAKLEAQGQGFAEGKLLMEPSSSRTSGGRK